MNILMNLENCSTLQSMNKGTKIARYYHKRKRKRLIHYMMILLLIILIICKSYINRNRSVINEMQEPIIVGFPLRGEWLSPTTPGTKIPSHGTNQLGTRYAYDFIQVDWERLGLPAYRGSLPQYLLRGMPLKEYYCWGQDVYSPCDGIVIQAQDGYEERERTNLRSDMINAYKNANSFDPQKDDIQSVAGNYIIIKYDSSVYAALVHLQTGSIQVSLGQNIKKGEVIGRVGHSGNSFAPHLHFQLMDSSNIAIANGIPCAFEEYELFQNGTWNKISNGIPTDKDRIRLN